MSELSRSISVALPSFEQFIGTRVSTIILRDPQLEKSGKQARAQLRSVPFFVDFGLDTVIHTELWDNGLDLVEYDHIPSQEAVSAADELSFPLVHIVTQEGIVEYGEEDLVRRLYDRSIEENGRYVLVTDTKSPRTPTYTKKPGKGLDEESAGVSVKNYEEKFDTYVEEYLDTSLAVNKTRNGFYHKVAAFHKHHGTNVSSVEELFDYSRAPPESPVWEPLYYFLEKDREGVAEGQSEYIREVLRSWTEKGPTQEIASRMFDLLDRHDFDREKVTDYRDRDPDHR